MMQITIPGFDIALTAGSGQCFRFNPLGEGRWRVVAFGRKLEITELENGSFLMDCDRESWERYWRPYFDLGRDYEAVKAAIPMEDAFLRQAAAYAGGLRILRQEPFETLISFIISQRKNLPAIKGCVEALSRRFGTQINEGIHAFPTPEQLAGAGEDALRACSLGYRAPYVAKTAAMVASGEVDLTAIGALDDQKLQTELLRFPGVGVKVADCAMLFGYGRASAFPKDVWILRVMQQHYGGKSPQERLGKYAGILQQYMFCYIRYLSHKK